MVGDLSISRLYLGSLSLTPPLILLLQLEALTSKIPAVGLGTLRKGGKIVGQDGMNLTGVIPIVINLQMVLTEKEEGPDPGTGTPDPTLANYAAAMTAAQTGQV